MKANKERIALDIHAHLAPVLKDRLGGIAGVARHETESSGDSGIGWSKGSRLVTNAWSERSSIGIRAPCLARVPT
jgi:hypothetical protein